MLAEDEMWLFEDPDSDLINEEQVNLSDLLGRHDRAEDADNLGLRALLRD